MEKQGRPFLPANDIDILCSMRVLLRKPGDVASEGLNLSGNSANLVAIFCSPVRDKQDHAIFIIRAQHQHV